MTDEEHTFREDARTKKDVARSARNQVKHGYRGKSLGVKQEHMTQKEWRKMNGEVKSYSLKRPMKWPEYTALPKDLKRDYLTGLRTRFDATTYQIGAMLGVSHSMVEREMGALKVAGRGRGKGLSRDAAAEQVQAWTMFVHGTKADRFEQPDQSPGDSDGVQNEAEVHTDPAEADPGKEEPALRLTQFSSQLRGPFDAEKISRLLTTLISPDAPVCITINVEHLED